MMKRTVFLLAGIILIFVIANVGAQEIDPIVKAYSCLDNRVNTTAISLDEAIFSALAAVPNDKVKNKINSEKSSSADCWPASACSVKTTSHVILAKKQLQENVTGALSWISGMSGVPTGLSWYLQITIDNSESAACKINYDDADYTVNLDAESKISGNPGSCLSIDSNNYRLKINNNCLEKRYNVNCDKGFRLNMLYQKNTGGTIYVSQETQRSSAGNSWLSEQIRAKCFKEGTSCNYEASLWAATALYGSNNESYQNYIPYLRALAEDNRQFFPSAFLRYLGDDRSDYDDVAGELSSRPDYSYWQVGSNAYYDTAIGILALGGCQRGSLSGPICNNPELEPVKEYLLQQQTPEGCWDSNDIKNTAFLLYAGWRRIIPSGTSNSTSGNITVGGVPPIIILPGGNVSSNGSTYNPQQPTSCESAGYYCARRDECLLEGGIIRSDSCASFAEVCCTVQISGSGSCSDLGGQVCRTGEEECTGNIVESSDGFCCLARCEQIEEDIEPDSEPQQPDDETPVSSGGSLWWIWLLAALIVLVVVGIIYRNQLRMMFFKSKKEKGKPISSEPAFMPRGPPRFGPPPTGMISRGAPQRPRPVTTRPAGRDKEMEETLRKLKKMSE